MKNIEHIVQRQINRWNSITQVLNYAPGRQPEQPAPVVEPGSLKHPPICISRELGSGAREICRCLCRRLGYEIFGSSIIDEIAKDMKVQRQLVDSLDEHGRSELEVLLESTLRGREIESQEYIRSLVRVVRTLGRNGGVVLLGRASTFILRERAALNVLVIAPLETRVRRMMEYDGVDEKAAREKVLDYDRRRETFLRKFFGTNIHDSGLFDLVINTGRIPPEHGCALVLEALKLRGFALEELALPAAARASCDETKG